MTAIIDHVGYGVSDYARSKEFYRQVLATLGIELLSDLTFGADKVAGFGVGQPSFWISSGLSARAATHIAFAAQSRAQVQAFYSVALSLGGRDNGAPGIRAHYHPNYYAAFVYDPDGFNIEAVCHVPE